MTSKTRVVGSGFTTLNFNGQAVAWLDAFTDSGQRPVGQGPEAIQSIGDSHPVEIAKPEAIGYGSLVMTMRELWNEPIWWQLAGLQGTNNILDVWHAMDAMPGEITAQMVIKPPGSPTWRGKIYHNVTIVDIDDGETVTIGAMTVPRTITTWYTHTEPLVAPAA